MTKAQGPRVAVLGEAMVELRQQDSAGDLYQLDYAGDAFNTAVGLSRLGIHAEFISLVGTDRFSQGIRARLVSEGMGTQGLLEHRRGRPGLYLIQTDGHGERQFHYWRSDSIARELLVDHSRFRQVMDRVLDCDALYLTGISIAVLGQRAWPQLLQLVEAACNRRMAVCFDSNWRPALWSDVEMARERIGTITALASLALPTLTDEAELWGDATPEAVWHRHRGAGVRELVVKCPRAEAMAFRDEQSWTVTSTYEGPVVDTTGAGDAFNAGYLAARWRGIGPADALAAAHACAATSLPVPGAIAPR